MNAEVEKDEFFFFLLLVSSLRSEQVIGKNANRRHRNIGRGCQ